MLRSSPLKTWSPLSMELSCNVGERQFTRCTAIASRKHTAFTWNRLIKDIPWSISCCSRHFPVGVDNVARCYSRLTLPLIDRCHPRRENKGKEPALNSLCVGYQPSSNRIWETRKYIVVTICTFYKLTCTQSSSCNEQETDAESDFRKCPPAVFTGVHQSSGPSLSRDSEGRT